MIFISHHASSPPVPCQWKLAKSRAWFAGLLWLIFWAGTGSAPAQNAGPSEYQVKAAFLCNFGSFVEWPSNSFSNAAAPLVIGVFGSDQFRADLERNVANRSNKNINGHPIAIRSINSFFDLTDCHILFVSATEQKRLPSILAKVERVNILTVSENVADFSTAGVMISFFPDGQNRIRFEINGDAASRAGLKVSSKLLALGRPAQR